MDALLVALVTASPLGSAAAIAADARPPRGWNSYDSFTWFVNETQFLDNCQYMADHLVQHGYDTCVIDYLWYQTSTTGEWLLDDYCRPIPDPERWPSSRNGAGFRNVADKVHAMGLKFGIHIMRGTSTFAVTKNCVVKDSHPETRIRAIATAECSWCTYSLSVNVSMDAGVRFYRSILEQYALEWQVDFLKNDCVFGSQFVPPEIAVQSQILESLASKHGRELTYSLSPGGHDTVDEIVSKGRSVASLVSMYRVNNDDWDNWDALNGHFDVAAAFARARLAGHRGLHGRPSFPDFDMLPLGFITSPSGNRSHYPYHMTNLTRGEQRMQMALWGIAPSPLFFGGDMRRMDKFTHSLLTNSDLLWLNHASTKSEQVRLDVQRGLRVWRAERNTTAGRATAVWPPTHGASSAIPITASTRHVAIFNTGGALASEALALSDFGAPPGSQCQLFDAWNGKAAGEVHGAEGRVDVRVPSHDVALLRGECQGASFS
jgi:hypothetical protein